MGKVSSVMGKQNQQQQPEEEVAPEVEYAATADYWAGTPEVPTERAQAVTTAKDFDFEGFQAQLDTREQEITDALLQPLDSSVVKQREGYGRDKRTGKQNMLDYLEWHTVTRALNRIFGFGGWSREVTDVTDYFETYPTGRADSSVPRAVRVTVRLTIHPRNSGMQGSYTLAGYQEVTPRAIWENGKKVGEEYTWGAYQMALGNAEAGAFKRAAAQLGNQFGLSLYEKDEEVVEGDSSAGRNGEASQAANVTPIRTNSSAAQCEECGREVTGYESKTGKKYTAQDMVRFSQRDCDGHTLCYTHKQEYQNSHR